MSHLNKTNFKKLKKPWNINLLHEPKNNYTIKINELKTAN